jgi:adenine-specific DNA-methyltransferase
MGGPRKKDRLIDPACGDGRFIAGHRNTVGIEQDVGAARGQWRTHRGRWFMKADFFARAAETTERFDCAAGNPPFIRYQHFSGATRAPTLLASHLRGLHSLWGQQDS